jgi:hypothetical protein
VKNIHLSFPKLGNTFISRIEVSFKIMPAKAITMYSLAVIATVNVCPSERCEKDNFTILMIIHI